MAFENDPNRNMPGYDQKGRWIGYESWGRKMSWGQGCGGAILFWLGVLVIIMIAYNTNGNHLFRDITNKIFITKTKKVEDDKNWLLEKVKNNPEKSWKQYLRDTLQFPKDVEDRIISGEYKGHPYEVIHEGQLNDIGLSTEKLDEVINYEKKQNLDN